MSIRLFLTGGTFDKSYNEITARLEFDKSHVDEMLATSRLTLDIRIDQLLLKDSLDLTQADRDLIALACQKADENQIVITHGTDTMVETARTIRKLTPPPNKTIILTGAMVPYSMGTKSDAMFNLGNALAFAQVLPPGVYIAMNGRYFLADTVRKDKTVGVFIEEH
jgi:L-asparaginase